VVTQPRAIIQQIAPGSIVSVKGVGANGLAGWDWATIMVDQPRADSVKTQR
jgi:hypothetical protein